MTAHDSERAVTEAERERIRRDVWEEAARWLEDGANAWDHPTRSALRAEARVFRKLASGETPRGWKRAQEPTP